MRNQLISGTSKKEILKKPESAQALMEVAILLPILLLLVLGTFDFGRLLFFKIVTTNAAREGANYISRNPSDATNGYVVTLAVTKEEANSSGLTLQSANIAVTDCCTSGLPVTVTVSKSIRLIFEKPLILFKIINGPVTIHSAERMMVQ